MTCKVCVTILIEAHSLKRKTKNDVSWSEISLVQGCKFSENLILPEFFRKFAEILAIAWKL